MEININQRKVSAGDKYNIFTNEKQTHFVTAVLFKFLSVIDLFDTDNKRRRMTINKRFFFVRAKYDITRWDNATFKFRTKSFWKNHYRCAVGKICMMCMGIREENIRCIKTEFKLVGGANKL